MLPPPGVLSSLSDAERLEQELKRLKVESLNRQANICELERDGTIGAAAVGSLEEERAALKACDGRIADLAVEVPCRYHDFMYPDHAEVFRAYRPQRDWDLDHQTMLLYELLVPEIADNYYSDPLFLENTEIAEAMVEGLGGLGGVCRLVLQLREGRMLAVERSCALITEADKKDHARHGCDGEYNRLRARRRLDGRPVIIIDQVGNPDYRPPRIALMPMKGLPNMKSAHQIRSNCHIRTSRAKSNGRRRVQSRSAGGGDDGGDGGGGGGSDPPGSAPRFVGGARYILPASGRDSRGHGHACAASPAVSFPRFRTTAASTRRGSDYLAIEVARITAFIPIDAVLEPKPLLALSTCASASSCLGDVYRCAANDRFSPPPSLLARRGAASLTLASLEATR